MRKLSKLLAAALMIVSFSVAGTAYAQYGDWEHHRGYYDRREEVRQPMTYVGRVVAFDRWDRTLIIRGLDGNMRFDMSRATVTGVVRPGRVVRVTYYTARDGRMVASSVNGRPWA